MTIEENIRNFLNSRHELDKDGAWTTHGEKVILGFFKVDYGILLFISFILLCNVLVLLHEFLMSYGFDGKSILIAMISACFCMILLFFCLSKINTKLTIYPDRLVYKGELRFGKRTREIRFDEINKIEIGEEFGLNFSSSGCKLYVDKDQTAYDIKIKYGDTHFLSISTSDITDKALFRLLRSAFRDKVYDYTDMDLKNSKSNVLNIIQLDALLVKTAMKTDSVDPQNIHKITVLQKAYLRQNYFHKLDMYDITNIEKAFSKSLNSKQKRYQFYCSQIRKNGKMLYDEKLELLDHFFAVAYSTNGVDQNELDVLHDIARFLSILDWDIINLEYRYECRKQEQQTETQSEPSPVSNTLLNKAYEVLGLSNGATLTDVKGAYRQLVKTCHPDTLPAKCSDDERESAVARFRAITEAYEVLIKE